MPFKVKEPQAGFALGVGAGGLEGKAMLAFMVAEPQFHATLGCKCRRAVPVKVAAQLMLVPPLLKAVLLVLVKQRAFTLPEDTVKV
jgi:hypothetical protein